MNIYNSFQVGGERCGIGFFGLVFPTVNFNKYIIHDGPLRGEYSKPITPVPVDTTNQEGAFGENPDLGGIFRYENE
jgi:hypothetical protein